MITVVMITLLALCAVAVVVTGPVAEEVGGLVGAEDTAVTVWDFAKWPVSSIYGSGTGFVTGPTVTTWAEQVQAFVAEMQGANVKYQVVGYPEVRHSFTNPDADAARQRFNLPLAFDREADENSWKQTMAFFDRLFENAPR